MIRSSPLLQRTYLPSATGWAKHQLPLNSFGISAALAALALSRRIRVTRCFIKQFSELAASCRWCASAPSRIKRFSATSQTPQRVPPRLRPTRPSASSIFVCAGIEPRAQLFACRATQAILARILWSYLSLCRSRSSPQSPRWFAQVSHAHSQGRCALGLHTSAVVWGHCQPTDIARTGIALASWHGSVSRDRDACGGCGCPLAFRRSLTPGLSLNGRSRSR
jgi:hypothetical protein